MSSVGDNDGAREYGDDKVVVRVGASMMVNGGIKMGMRS